MPSAYDRMDDDAQTTLPRVKCGSRRRLGASDRRQRITFAVIASCVVLSVVVLFNKDDVTAVTVSTQAKPQNLTSSSLRVEVIKEVTEDTGKATVDGDDGGKLALEERQNLTSSSLKVEVMKEVTDDAEDTGKAIADGDEGDKPALEETESAKPPRRQCLISARGSDGIGHQLEAKISCIATAAALADLGVQYVHFPLANAEHGVKSHELAVIEDIFNLTRFGSLDPATLQVAKREPLPWVGHCDERSWFDDIKNKTCSKCLAGPTRVVCVR